MKQLTQNLKKGALTIEEVPVPLCKSGGILVKTLYSAVSVGTEKMKLKNADMSYLQMAKSKPEKAKQVFNTLTQLGPFATYRKVMNKLDSLSPLGYSTAGKVIEVGEDVSNFNIGDLVACAGGGYANHAEVNYIPKNLCTKIPNGVDVKEASFTTIASIALQGLRQSNIQIGENIGVIGLGLLGQILVQLIQANGGAVFGFDIDKKKCELAEKQGATFTSIADKEDFEEEILSLTNGYGCDAVIITTGTTSNSPIILAGKIARDKARIVDIGITKMNLPWELYYHKELDFRFSRSYGPGRYDPKYEEGGKDYPIGYVRWTEQRNMESVLKLLKSRNLNFSKLITHSFHFNEAEKAYKLIEKDENDFLGVVFKYDKDSDISSKTIKINDKFPKNNKILIGGIGCGNYASTMLFPFLKKNSDINFIGLSTATGINVKDKAQKYGFRYATTDYKSLLNDNNVNTILIATRHNQHAKMVIDSLNAGKNVYVEKPLALTKKELKNTIQAYEKSNKILTVGYNRRFSPSIQYLQNLLNPSIPYSIHYNINAGFVPEDNWYQSPKQKGRIIGECGHFIDTIQYLIDAKPVSVFASSTETQDMPEQDNSFICIKFDNGSTGVISYLSDGDKKYPKEKIFITGFRTNIEFDNFKEIKTYKDGKLKKKKFLIKDKGQKNEMKCLVESIKNGEPPISFKSLILTTLTTILAIESIRANKLKSISFEDLN